MKHIGIVTVSPEGSLLCYRKILSEAKRLGYGDDHPEISIHMQPFSSYLQTIGKKDWPAVSELVVDSIEKLRRSGAQLAIIPSNTIHFAIAEIESRSSLPVISIVDVVADECEKRGHGRVAALGTSWMMAGGLYDDALKKRGIEPLVPDFEDQETIQFIILQELVFGVIRQDSTARLLAIVEKLKAKDCEAILFGCTELPLVLNEENCDLPAIDSTLLLGAEALHRALADES